MICLESRIIEHIREIILKEDFDDLRKGDTLHEFFQKKADIFSYFKNFKMNELTLKYIECLEEAVKELKNPEMTEEEFEKVREKFKAQEQHWRSFYPYDIAGRTLAINKYDRLEISSAFETLSFSLYEFAKKEYEGLESRTEEEKKELLEKTSLIHNYLRDHSFVATADAIGELKLACRDGKEPWKNMYRKEK
ncbi:MAG: hypothetical protein HXM49_03740 [Leptotrichia sp.]|nr:hypothetical protein [Leptotrichia sp.]